MRSLETKLGNAVFRNPVFGASGCSGHGYELKNYTDLSAYGALSLKTVTYHARKGNPPQRITEVASGIMSSVGLQNDGPDKYFAEIMPKVFDVLDRNQILLSLAGDTLEEYVELVPDSGIVPKAKLEALLEKRKQEQARQQLMQQQMMEQQEAEEEQRLAVARANGELEEDDDEDEEKSSAPVQKKKQSVEDEE